MRVGIAGAGTIVPDFLEALKKVEQMEGYAICASERSKERMQQFSFTYGITKIYCNYQEMLKDSKIDVIYIAVPNHLHGLFTKQALEKGKSVICEKPFCSNVQEAEQMVQLAREKGLYLFEAISNQYLPNYQKIKELLPKLGKMKIAELNYSQYSRRYDAFKQGEVLPVFDPKKSGGVLMDLNLYNLYFMVGLFGEPKEIQYYANIERGIDTSGILIIKYEDFVASLTAAKDCMAPGCINLQGEEGYIHSDDPSNGFRTFIYGKNSGEETQFALNKAEERLYYELQAFSDMVRKEDWQENERHMKDSLLVMKLLDTARRQAGIEIVEENMLE